MPSNSREHRSGNGKPPLWTASSRDMAFDAQPLLVNGAAIHNPSFAVRTHPVAWRTKRWPDKNGCHWRAPFVDRVLRRPPSSSRAPQKPYPAVLRRGHCDQERPYAAVKRPGAEETGASARGGGGDTGVSAVFGGQNPQAVPCRDSSLRCPSSKIGILIWGLKPRRFRAHPRIRDVSRETGRSHSHLKRIGRGCP
jgi:hypothetical protein